MTTELQTLQTELDRLNALLVDAQDKLADIAQNPEEYADLESLYNEELDEIYAEACEALPVYITGSQLIAEFDPTMWRCGFSVFCSNYDASNLHEYQLVTDEIEELEAEIEDIEEQIEELEQEEGE